MKPANLSTFDFNGAAVRVLTDEAGDARWIAKDVCELLGLANVTEALRSLDEDEKGRVTFLEPDVSQPESGAIPRTYATISEPGLYALILKSTKPQAREFRRWVTHEVLPRIRRGGFYVQDGDESRVRDVLDRILRHRENRARWELTWSRDVVAAVAPIYGLTAGSQFPIWMCGIIRRLYDELFGVETMDEARRRRGPHTGKGNLLTQYFTDEAKEYLRSHVDVVLALAKTSSSPDDFWAKISAVFGKSMLQLPMFTDDACCSQCGAPIQPGAKFCCNCGAKLGG